ncbi:MAG TPA: class D beta-lactamase [Cytophagales bacterium]|jgi:beta-lactamase class D|nr:class D beta-lactamase [Cytophagales bacterium]
MKALYFAMIITLVFSCTKRREVSDKTGDHAVAAEVVVPEFQSILDTNHLNGAILIYDFANDKYYANDFDWARKGQLPASTFKIANSIIALETGVVENDSTLFEWDGEKRALKVWEQDLIFRDAFQYSCVPCYQQVARKIGVKAMNAYLTKLDYGNMQVDSTNIDRFWLEGASRISPFQQIDFLKRFYQSELPIAARTVNIMKRLMVIEQNDKYVLRGKTGWSIRNGNNNGWFVGYIEAGGKVHFFATNVAPEEQFDMEIFSMIRKEATYKALEELGFCSIPGSGIAGTCVECFGFGFTSRRKENRGHALAGDQGICSLAN